MTFTKICDSSSQVDNSDEAYYDAGDTAIANFCDGTAGKALYTAELEIPNQFCDNNEPADTIGTNEGECIECECLDKNDNQVPGVEETSHYTFYITCTEGSPKRDIQIYFVRNNYAWDNPDEYQLTCTEIGIDGVAGAGGVTYAWCDQAFEKGIAEGNRVEKTGTDSGIYTISGFDLSYCGSYIELKNEAGTADAGITTGLEDFTLTVKKSCTGTNCNKVWVDKETPASCEEHCDGGTFFWRDDATMTKLHGYPAARYAPWTWLVRDCARDCAAAKGKDRLPCENERTGGATDVVATDMHYDLWFRVADDDADPVNFTKVTDCTYKTYTSDEPTYVAPAATFTVGSDASDDYATIAAAFTALSSMGNHIQDVIFVLRGEDHTINSAIEFSTTGINPNSFLNSVTIRPASGTAHEGNVAANGAGGKCRIIWSGNYQFIWGTTANAPEFTFEDLLIDFNGNNPGTNFQGMWSLRNTNAQTINIKRCIMRNISTSNRGNFMIEGKPNHSIALNMYNSLIYKFTSTSTGSGTSGFIRYQNPSNQPLSIYHCTFHDATTVNNACRGVSAVSGAGGAIKNSIVSDCTSSSSTDRCIQGNSTNLPKTNCLASDITGAPSALDNEASTDTFDDPNNASLTSRDYEVKNTSAGYLAATALGSSLDFRKVILSPWYDDTLLRDATGSVTVGTGCCTASAYSFYPIYNECCDGGCVCECDENENVVNFINDCKGRENNSCDCYGLDTNPCIGYANQTIIIPCGYKDASGQQKSCDE